MSINEDQSANVTETVVFKDAGLHWLELPPIAWQAEVDKMKDGNKQEVSRWLDGVIERAARLQGYLDGRGAIGCGDGGHDAGVKESNRNVAKVRKALGFNQARNDVRF